MNTFLNSIPLAIAVLFVFGAASPHVSAAGTSDLNNRIELVSIGDAEEKVRQLLGLEPDRVQNSNILGVRKSTLEFDIGATQHELVFYSGYLVSKTRRTRKPTLLDRLPF